MITNVVSSDDVVCPYMTFLIYDVILIFESCIVVKLIRSGFKLLFWRTVKVSINSK